MCVFGYLSDDSRHGEVWTEEVVKSFFGESVGVLLELEVLVAMKVKVFGASMKCGFFLRQYRPSLGVFVVYQLEILELVSFYVPLLSRVRVESTSINWLD